MSRCPGIQRRVFSLLSISIATALWLGAATAGHQVLQRGVSVELAPTHHAEAMPGADQPGAVIVAVTRNGNLFLGADPVAQETLAGRVRRSVSRSSGKTVYVKADARTSYAAIATVLEALRRAGATAPVLLTVQRDTSGTMPVPPYGLKVQTGAVAPRTSAAVIEILPPGQHPVLKLNGISISDEALASLLHGVTSVTVKADGHVQFGEVVKVIDACRSAGATTGLR